MSPFLNSIFNFVLKKNKNLACILWRKQEDGWEVGWCMKNIIGEKRTEVVNSLAPALFWCVHCRQWMSFWENPDSWRERIKWATFSIPLYTGPLPWLHKAYTFLTPKVDLNKKHHLAHCYTWACIHFHMQINWATFSAGTCAYISVCKRNYCTSPLMLKIYPTLHRAKQLVISDD